VGINVLKVFAADGLSFAVPVDEIAKIMEQFQKRG
jgi:HtrA serine peptidase 2